MNTPALVENALILARDELTRLGMSPGQRPSEDALGPAIDLLGWTNAALLEALQARAQPWGFVADASGGARLVPLGHGAPSPAPDPCDSAARDHLQVQATLRDLAGRARSARQRYGHPRIFLEFGRRAATGTDTGGALPETAPLLRLAVELARPTPTSRWQMSVACAPRAIEAPRPAGVEPTQTWPDPPEIGSARQWQDYFKALGVVLENSGIENWECESIQLRVGSASAAAQLADLAPERWRDLELDQHPALVQLASVICDSSDRSASEETTDEAPATPSSDAILGDNPELLRDETSVVLSGGNVSSLAGLFADPRYQQCIQSHERAMSTLVVADTAVELEDFRRRLDDELRERSLVLHDPSLPATEILARVQRRLKRPGEAADARAVTHAIDELALDADGTTFESAQQRWARACALLREAGAPASFDGGRSLSHAEYAAAEPIVDKLVDLRQRVHAVDGPEAGRPCSVVSRLSSAASTVAAAWGVPTPTHARACKRLLHTLDRLAPLKTSPLVVGLARAAAQMRDMAELQTVLHAGLIAHRSGPQLADEIRDEAWTCDIAALRALVREADEARLGRFSASYRNAKVRLQALWHTEIPHQPSQWVRMCETLARVREANAVLERHTPALESIWNGEPPEDPDSWAEAFDTADRLDSLLRTLPASESRTRARRAIAEGCLTDATLATARDLRDALEAWDSQREQLRALVMTGADDDTDQRSDDSALGGAELDEIDELEFSRWLDDTNPHSGPSAIKATLHHQMEALYAHLEQADGGTVSAFARRWHGSAHALKAQLDYAYFAPIAATGRATLERRPEAQPSELALDPLDAASVQPWTASRLIAQLGPSLRELCPIWLTTPSAIPQLLGPELAAFDLVVLCQARHARLADALLPLLRARRVWVGLEAPATRGDESTADKQQSGHWAEQLVAHGAPHLELIERRPAATLAPQAVPPTPPATPTLRWTSHYAVTAPSDLEHAPSCGVEDLSEAQLNELVTSIVRVEGPIHQELVARRVRELCGRTRMHPSTHRRITRAIDQSEVRAAIVRRGHFLLAADKLKIKVRNRERLPAYERRFEYVSDQELAAAILTTLRRIGAGSRVQTVERARQLLGIAGIDAQTRGRFARALHTLARLRRVRRDGDSWIADTTPREAGPEAAPSASSNS